MEFFKAFNHAMGIPLGALFAVVGVAMFFFLPRMIAWETDPLDTNAVYTANVPLTLNQGLTVQGTIADDTPHLYGDRIVLGTQQVRTDDGWSDREDFVQNVWLDVDGGRILVVGMVGGTRGEVVELPIPDKSGQRVVGYERGSTVVVTGAVEAIDPPTVRAEYNYGGSVDDYRAMLSSATPIIYGASCMFTCVGLLVMVIAGRRAMAAVT